MKRFKKELLVVLLLVSTFANLNCNRIIELGDDNSLIVYKSEDDKPPYGGNEK